MMMDRLLNPIKARIRLLVGKCIITACGGDTANLSLLAGENREDVEFLQQYGFYSRPVGNVSGVALFVGGSRDNGVVVASKGEDGEMKVNLEPGEVALHTKFGSTVLLKKDGSVVVSTRLNKLRVEGDIEATGNVKAKCDTAFVTLTGHMHPTAAQGAPSTPTPGM